MRSINQSYPFFKICLLFLLAVMIFGCASSELTRFKKNTMTMSDSELLSSYHGINERIKDIDNSIERGDPIDNSQNRDMISHQTYIVGGEAYGLMQKEKLVLEELRRRNIKP